MKDSNLMATFVFKCAECGKRIEITVPSEYTFKIEKKFKNGSVGHDWFCSYKCMHNFKKKQGKFELSDKVEQAIKNDNSEALR